MRLALIVCTLAVVAAENSRAATVGEPFRISSDYQALYVIEELGGKGQIRTIVVRRDGSSGVSFSKHEVNCNAKLARYLGSGGSLQEMAKSKPSPTMGPLISGSISYYIADKACEPYYDSKRRSGIRQ